MSRLSTLFTMKTASGCALRFYPSSVSATMWCDPGFYRDDEAILEACLRSGDVFVDVGANVGVLTLRASRIVGDSGRVVSIEAHPKTFKYLCGNLRLNGVKNVTPIHAALGQSEGRVSLSCGRADDQNRVSEQGVEVPLRSLDSIMSGIHVRLIKIDVEGFELFVLRGAEGILKGVDFIYYESWDEHYQRYGYHSGEVLHFLADRGFRTEFSATHRSQCLENILAVRERE